MSFDPKQHCILCIPEYITVCQDCCNTPIRIVTGPECPDESKGEKNESLHVERDVARHMALAILLAMGGRVVAKDGTGERIELRVPMSLKDLCVMELLP